MLQNNLNTKLFIDSGSVEDTRSIIESMGFIDGQTTNPSLIAKSSGAKARLDAGEKFTPEEVNEFYKNTVKDIREVMPEGSISIEVYADADTKAEQMIEQGTEMNTWIPGAHIKLPTTAEGLKAARNFVDAGINVNMTLVFSQQQAAAVYVATTGAKKGQVFLSPFIGRLDDIGQDGMSLIENILKMYREQGDGHVQVLIASVRSMEHLKAAVALKSDIITVPLKQLLAWKDAGMEVPELFIYAPDGLSPIPFEELDFTQGVEAFDIGHDLTDKGLKKFAEDWNSIISTN
jgi:transaldolase